MRALLAGEWRAAARRRGHHLSLPDALIAGAAHTVDAVVLTRNLRDFALTDARVEGYSTASRRVSGYRHGHPVPHRTPITRRDPHRCVRRACPSSCSPRPCSRGPRPRHARGTCRCPGGQDHRARPGVVTANAHLGVRPHRLPGGSDPARRRHGRVRPGDRAPAPRRSVRGTGGRPWGHPGARRGRAGRDARGGAGGRR